MNPTRSQRLWRRCADLLLAAGALVWLAAAPAFAAEDPMPRPPELERDVQFWIRVYTQVDTNSGFLHDDENLAVVYETLHFSPSAPPHERQRIVEAARDHYVEALRRIAGVSGALSEEDQRIRDLWGIEGTPARLLESTEHIRFQLGQSDRFREGLRRSGAWKAHVAETLANLGLPAELAVLPHVESSFNPAAYSKVGAAGLWQFMRSTGRRYLHIDSTVDDRLDPFRSTQAAAQLLAYNYHLLGTWPLALTAYNHGAEGVRRAKETLGTDDIVTIVRKYKGRTFGFASRNFYVSFLAALEIDHNPEKYFGGIEPNREMKFQEVALPAFIQLSSLEHLLKIDQQRLQALNPALLPAVWNGQRHVPKGYHLRLPLDGEKWTTEELAARLSPHDLYVAQLEPRRYRVQRAETLGMIAARYNVTTADLAQLNGMSPSAKLRPGRSLVVPSAQPAPVVVAQNTPAPASAAAAPSPPAAPSAAPAVSVAAAAKPAAPASAAPVTSPPVSPAPPVRVATATPPPPVSPAAAASATPAAHHATGAVTIEVAQLESKEDAEQIAKIGRPAARAEPVSAAQAEELSPALGPGVEVSVSPDPTDYSIAKDDTIKVATVETLGHYADWLGTSAARLRVINHLAFKKPVLIGHKIKLEFVKVSREEFEQKRREYHREQQASYFASHRIVGTEVYLARHGDSGWTVTQHNAALPLWLLQQYNPDLDLSEMHPGTQIVVPKIEEVSAAGG
ncbi:MAG TPA: transglycosylase SLT domain-containing protein [Steroidobacteraceae bacterium]|jgi:membrane-bound lytic murein transglycosylase D|nr:transglycosylase SLT domain-containing protein [Steroidobacteraceae bacterium]